MIINSIQIHNNQTKNINSKPNFRSKIQHQSYEMFMEKCKSLKIGANDIIKQCESKNIIGSGKHSVVYKFSISELKDWVVKILGNKEFESSKNWLIEKINDKFGSVNLGQAIAKIGESALILKRVNGEVHSLPNWASIAETDFKENMITKNDAEIFAQKLKSISEFPIESFFAYAEELKHINDCGYKADSFNPNNLLIGYENKRIHIIDFYQYELDQNRNTKYDLILPLLDLAFFDKYLEKLDNPKDFIKSANEIFAKCSYCAEKLNINCSEKTYIDYIFDVDSRLNLNDLYSSRYRNIKKLCGF